MIPIDLDAIDARLRGGDLWVRGWGIVSDPDEPTCLHGAIRYCQPVPGDAYLIEKVGDLYGWGIAANDNADSWPEIRAKVPPVVTDEMLAETFGPQWVHIVALVRRAAVLTREEVAPLDAAWDAAWGAAWGAAWTAARAAAWAASRAAAWDAMRDAMRAAASDTARAAAWTASRAAAGALSVRDLIGQHGFTQEHYDALTRLWRTVIGPLHPDDAPMGAAVEVVP